MHPSSSSLVAFGMSGVVLVVAVLLVAGFSRAGMTSQPRVATGTWVFAGCLVAWLVIVAALGASGVLRVYVTKPPPMVLMVLAGFAIAVVTACSGIGRRFARGLPLASLIAFQAFRLPLELVMHRAASEGTMPEQMSFSGWNFDILTGVTAIVVAVAAARGMAPRWLLYAWGMLSSALLAAIIVIAVVSTPLVAAFGTAPERLNTWVGFFPFAWLPGFLVPAALFGQIVFFRRLATK